MGPILIGTRVRFWRVRFGDIYRLRSKLDSVVCGEPSLYLLCNCYLSVSLNRYSVCTVPEPAIPSQPASQSSRMVNYIAGGRLGTPYCGCLTSYSAIISLFPVGYLPQLLSAFALHMALVRERKRNVSSWTRWPDSWPVQPHTLYTRARSLVGTTPLSNPWRYTFMYTHPRLNSTLKIHLPKSCLFGVKPVEFEEYMMECFTKDFVCI